jgi:hypothetical protein
MRAAEANKAPISISAIKLREVDLDLSRSTDLF